MSRFVLPCSMRSRISASRDVSSPKPLSARRSAASAATRRSKTALQYIVLVARETFELRGHTLARGDEIMACVGSANRDEAVFDDPDRLDFTRSNHKDLLSMGTGPWRCMGARLALRIASVAFAKIVACGFALAPNAPPLQWVRQPIVQR